MSGDTVRHEQERALREKNGTIVESYLEAKVSRYELALEEIAGNPAFGWAQEIAIEALKGQ